MIILIGLILSLPVKYEFVCDSSSIVIKSEKIEFQEYVPLKPIIDLLDLSYVLDNASQRLYLSSPDHKIFMIADISVLQCDTTYRSLAFPPRYIEDQIYFPVQEIIPVLGGTFEKLIFVKEIKEVPVVDKISLFTRADSTVLKFDWKQPLEFDVQFSLQKVIVEIDGVYNGEEKLKPSGEIKSVEVLPYNTYTRLEFEMGDVNSLLERTDEVVFYKKTTERIALVVIDPGHGGVDPGAVGKKGLYEKDINLDISDLLKEFIEDSLGLAVILTRNKDQYLSLKKRADIANRNNADLFLSIHNNASPRNKEARGFETYFLSEARTTEARAVAAMENASLKFDEEAGPTDDLSFIFYDLAQSAFLDESNLLAEFIQTNAEDFLSIPARGVSQAGFYVLRGAFMPAVLVEAAFISNLEEEKLLRQKLFKRKLAYSIFRGLVEYIKDYERRVNN